MVIDEVKCRENIAAMALRIRRAGLQFRPHFKTHQSLRIGEWFREEGVEAITVSSFAMALYFVRTGWKNITVAIPFSPLEIDAIHAVAANAKLNLVTATVEAVEGLGPLLRYPVSLWIKVDAGYGRAGVPPAEAETIYKILETAARFPHISIAGLLGHAGQSYQARNQKDILKVHENSMAIVKQLRESYSSAIPNLKISMGDTPTCSLATSWPGVDELRPGNFAFYDLQQSQITSCTDAQIAVALACPIIDVRRDRSEVIVHGGSVHFSKDWLKDEEGQLTFGYVAEKKSDGWGSVNRQARMRSLSQEHGILQVPSAELNQYKPGGWVYILPVHSCLAAESMAHYHGLSGKSYDHFKTGYRQ
jgi:D-serine deaminase-like pyridoxal phosphate-dependent protein